MVSWIRQIIASPNSRIFRASHKVGSRLLSGAGANDSFRLQNNKGIWIHARHIHCFSKHLRVGDARYQRRDGLSTFRTRTGTHAGQCSPAASAASSHVLGIYGACIRRIHGATVGGIRSVECRLQAGTAARLLPERFTFDVL